MVLRWVLKAVPSYPHIFLSTLSPAMLARMTKQTLILPPEPETTETLLQGLIAECGAMIREQFRPAIDATDDRYEKCGYANTAINLVKIATKVGDTVARLRGQAEPELRQRITVERIQRLSTNPGEGG
jgi:hypothetical protein